MCSDGKIKREHKLEKLENPARVAELNPAATLEKAGVGTGETVCDVGAGSGIFSLAAARITGADVWAVDTDGDILAALRKSAEAQSLSNIHTPAVSGYSYDLPDGCADWALLVTVLHEIDDPQKLFAELRRILKKTGRLMIVEFRGGNTPAGPPAAYRLSAEETDRICGGGGFCKTQEFLLGENFYCQTYRRA